MEKMKRTERIAALTRILTEAPNRLMTLGQFCRRFSAARSTMSEDISMIDEALQKHGLGRLDTLPGAAGGVRFRPVLERKAAYGEVRAVADLLCDPGRALAGGYLYWSDVLSAPDIVRKMGSIIAGKFYDQKIDFVLTMETKGIPVALMTAEALGVPLVIARRMSKVYEGSAVNINYLSGSGRVETMALSRRAVREGQGCLIVDDFIRAGGTAGGMVSLMQEFQVEVRGLAFMLAEEAPKEKQVTGDVSLMTFREDGGRLFVRPAEWLREGLE